MIIAFMLLSNMYLKNFPEVLSCCICLLIFVQTSWGTNYQNGDSLYVVSFSRLNVRVAPGTTSEVVGNLESNSRVRILNTFGFQESRADTIDGFSGHWVKMSFRNLSGYVFDAYLSKYPVYVDFDTEPGDIYPDLLANYCLKTMGPVVCEMDYHNGSDGEGYQMHTLRKLANGYDLMSTTYWESNSCSIGLNAPRPSEVYFLVSHLLAKADDGMEESLLSVALKKDFDTTSPYYHWAVRYGDYNRVLIKIPGGRDSTVYVTFYWDY